MSPRISLRQARHVYTHVRLRDPIWVPWLRSWLRSNWLAEAHRLVNGVYFTMPCCAVLNCSNYRKGKSEYKYFRFPKDKETCAKWIHLCGREKKTDFNPATQRVCSRHFLPSAFQRNLKYELLRLPVPSNQIAFKPGAVPTLHLPLPPATSKYLSSTFSSSVFVFVCVCVCVCVSVRLCLCVCLSIIIIFIRCKSSYTYYKMVMHQSY